MRSVSDQLSLGDRVDGEIHADKDDFDVIVTLGYYDGAGYTAPDTNVDLSFPDGDHDYDDFERAADRVREELREGNLVLAHCQAGISRSTCVGAAAIAVENGLPWDEAYDRCKNGQIEAASQMIESLQRYVAENR